MYNKPLLLENLAMHNIYTHIYAHACFSVFKLGPRVNDKITNILYMALEFGAQLGFWISLSEKANVVGLG